MNCARSCENLLNFVKVMPKLLLVPFSGHGVVGYVKHDPTSKIMWKIICIADAAATQKVADNITSTSFRQTLICHMTSLVNKD